MKNKHLLKLLDLSREEIHEILDLADQLKYDQKHGIPHEVLKGKTLAMIFSKNSTRTRVSFEVGMFQLGGHALFLSDSVSQIGRGEPVQDTARVISRYCDGIMIRTYAQQEAEDLAKYGSVPVINGLTDFSHPCQVLADLMTVREHKAQLEGLKACYIGDGNNMANSIIVGGLKCGMDVSIASPSGYTPDPRLHPHRRSRGGGQGRGRDLHRRMGLHGPRGGAGPAGQGLRGLPGERRADGRGKAGLHGAALPARPPGGGDHRGGVRGPRNRDLR